MASLKAVSPSRALAHGVDDVGALAPALDHLEDQLGRVLQVGVDHRDDVAGGVLQAGGERGLVAEVAGEMDHAHARVGGGELVEQLGRAVGGAVVDEHELEVRAATAAQVRETNSSTSSSSS